MSEEERKAILNLIYAIAKGLDAVNSMRFGDNDKTKEDLDSAARELEKASEILLKPEGKA